ncbi:MAG: 4Fe-4S dicluster domain-containing protein [Phycisphaerae bacterium]|nr:4Fe-4S dicluster domain-containing protein [Phycisphaerae bacterium]
MLAGTPLGREAPGLDLCVHCGFCLQSCPTYLVLEDENDSPRGRLLLMRAAVEGTLPIEDPDLSAHLDRCLGCRACETACPSGAGQASRIQTARTDGWHSRRWAAVFQKASSCGRASASRNVC